MKVKAVLAGDGPTFGGSWRLSWTREAGWSGTSQAVQAVRDLVFGPPDYENAEAYLKEVADLLGATSLRVVGHDSHPPGTVA